MKLRTKTLAVLIVTLLVITAATYATADNIVAGSFADLEQNEARQNLDRTEQALGVEMNRLSSSAGDWSTWDDTYQFVQDGNTAYIDANLYDATLQNLRVDMMGFFDADAQPVRIQAIDVEGVGTDVADSTAAVLSESAPLFDHDGTGDSTTGFVKTPTGTLIVASRPVTTSEGEGPIAGTVVLARWVDQRLVDELTAITKLDIALAPALPSAATGEQTLETTGSDTLHATTVIGDVNGDPALTAELTMPRTIFAEGQDTLRYLLISLLIIGIAFLALITLMLELTVLRPAARLSAFVSSVGTRLNARAPQASSDEMGHLGRSINGMLDTIEQYSSALASANADLSLERERINELNRSLEAKVAERTAELEMANSELTDRNRQLITAMKQASTDGLTGLKNHRSFQEDIRNAVDKGHQGYELAVFMADLDHFKHVNDELGHQVGDQILTNVGSVFRQVLDEQAVFRYGGDEFAMMTWVTSLRHAEDLAEEIRRRVAAKFTEYQVTVSVGVALYAEASSPEELVYHADAAMYAAKAAGKNRVRVWTRGGVGLPATDAVGS